MTENRTAQILQEAGMKLIQASALTGGSEYTSRMSLEHIAAARPLMADAETRLKQRLKALEEVDR
jgi:hypothetical protein